jgi:L-ascorbate metabolism protein UlaG (beta-lactamase superfamily)
MTAALTLSKFRHSCLLIEIGDARILLDPGVFSSGFETLTDLSGVLITHQHFDHLDVDRLGDLLEHNPQAELIADKASAAQLAEKGLNAKVVMGGQALSVGGVPIAVYGSEHAQIAPGIPVPPNVGYAIDGRFAYAGDAYMTPPEPVQVLAIPTCAPWLRAADTVGFLQKAKPEAVVPVHEALLATTDVYYGIYRSFSEQQGTAFHVIDDGVPKSFGVAS